MGLMGASVSNALHPCTCILLFQTLELLFVMINQKNVLTITTRLIEAMTDSKDSFLRSSIASKLFSVIKRHGQNAELFIKISMDLLLKAHDVLPQGFEDYVMEYCRVMPNVNPKPQVVKAFWSILDRDKLNPVMVRLAVSVSYFESIAK